MTDFPGYANLERIDCGPQSAPSRAYFVAHFVPAHQVIELEIYKNEKTQPHRTRIPIAYCRRFD